MPFIRKVTGVKDMWNPCLQALEGHAGTIGTLAFSPDGKLLASGSRDSTVRLWDTATGACKQTLREDEDVTSLLLSKDGQHLESHQRRLSFNSDSTGFSLKQRPSSSAIVVDKEWVTQHGQKFLWLPPEQRPTCVAFLS